MEVAKEEHDASHEKARAALVEEMEELRGERRIQLKKMEEQQRLAAQLRVQVCLSAVCAGVYCRSFVDQTEASLWIHQRPFLHMHMTFSHMHTYFSGCMLLISVWGWRSCVGKTFCLGWARV